MQCDPILLTTKNELCNARSSASSAQHAIVHCLHTRIVFYPEVQEVLMASNKVRGGIRIEQGGDEGKSRALNSGVIVR